MGPREVRQHGPSLLRAADARPFFFFFVSHYPNRSTGVNTPARNTPKTRTELQAVQYVGRTRICDFSGHDDFIEHRIHFVELKHKIFLAHVGKVSIQNFDK